MEFAEEIILLVRDVLTKLHVITILKHFLMTEAVNTLKNFMIVKVVSMTLMKMEYVMN